MTPTEQILHFFSESTAPVLFAGAGVSARAGLPVWNAYLQHLAESLRQDDALSANQIMEAMAEGDLLVAATYFFISRKMRIGDKYSNLTAPLKKFDVKEIACLAGLPFKAYATTNYDRALPDLFAYVNHKSPICYDLGDPALATAPYSGDFFVARIHGKIESPQTMILSKEHYDNLASITGYVDFLRHILTHCQVLFLGFSFYDPAIRKVLELVNSEIGPLHDGRHLALIPESSDSEFVARLERLNIKRSLYDPANHHEALWRSICEAASALASQQPTSTPVVSVESAPMALAHRYLASCYARAQLSDRLMPLREVVLEGMIGYHLMKAGDAGATIRELSVPIRGCLAIPNSDAEKIVRESLNRLMKDSLCTRYKDSEAVHRFRWKGPLETNGLENGIAILVRGTVNRFVVREQGTETADIRKTLTEFYDLLVLRRGWDLGAAFAARRPPEHIDVDLLMWQVGVALSPKVIEGLIFSAKDLLRAPTTEEAEILCSLGRSSFALEMAIQSPQDMLLHKEILPQKIYLDASVLLPAIIPGHPLHDAYKQSISRFIEAADRATVGLNILALRGFLNEIVSHRKIALETVNSLGDQLHAELTRLVSFSGAVGINVYLGAYASHLARDNSLGFSEFIEKFAPYNNEEDLVNWLGSQGIKVVSATVVTSESTIYGEIYHELEKAFSEDLSRGKRNPITVRHDAIQLTAIDEDRKHGVRSIFVTADRTLRQYVGSSKHPSLAANMLSNVGLAQLVEILVGGRNNGAALSMSRLLWSAKVSSDLEIARNYFIDLALEKFDEAIAMNMGDVVEHIAHAAAMDAKAKGISLVQPTENDRLPAARLLGQFEDRFFEGLKDVIERRRRE
jgi:hypothetical protein